MKTSDLFLFLILMLICVNMYRTAAPPTNEHHDGVTVEYAGHVDRPSGPIKTLSDGCIEYDVIEWGTGATQHRIICGTFQIYR